MPSSPAPPQSTSPNDPCFPPELFLEIFSHADLPTLSALSSSSLAFLELATPFLYNTVHFDDLPLSSISRTPTLSELFPQLALNSVQTLHLTLPTHLSAYSFPPSIARLLPRLEHIHIHHSLQAERFEDVSWGDCPDFLLELDPVSISFDLIATALPNTFRLWLANRLGWIAFASNWTRLKSVTVGGGSIQYVSSVNNDFWSSFTLFQQADASLDSTGGPDSFSLTYDLRALDGGCEDVILWFPEELLNERIFHLPLDKVFVKTSHKGTFEFAEDVLGELVERDEQDGEGKGIPCSARVGYRDLVRISLETEVERGVLLADTDRWRRRGKGIVGTR